jgi:hypothetical protein
MYINLWTTFKTEYKGGRILDDAPIRIILLRDADKCAVNESLKKVRSECTIKELESEYEDWFNLYGKTTEVSLMGLQNELPCVQGGLEQFIECQNKIIAHVDRGHMSFFPFNII